ncbi:MAG TPA: hypothetical protein VN519_06795 [Bryobacteraceae bacterium]|nr:hypothetical protein [Bryobacteraceae bacterium]
MSQIFVPGGARKGFDGAFVCATDPASGSPVSYCFANDIVRLSLSDNRGYADAVDNSGLTHITIPGVRTGAIQVMGNLQPDRSIGALINTAFGARVNGGLTPWVGSLIPYSGGTARTFTGLWWNTLDLYGQYSQGGVPGKIGYTLSGAIADPLNSLAASDLSIPAAAGTIGAGVPHFIQCGFGNGASSSPTTYDSIRAFRLTLNNRLSAQPSAKSRTARISNGYVPGPLIGSYVMTQLLGATQAIPLAAGVYPIEIQIPTGDGSHTLLVDLTVSYDADSTSVSPNDYAPNVGAYTVFGTNSVNSASSWPINTSYS